MLSFIIKFYFRYLCCIYNCFKIMNFNFKNPIRKCFLFVFPLFLTILSYIINSNFNGLDYIIPIIFLWIATSLFTQYPKAAYVATMLSFGITYSLFALCGTITLTILFPIFPDKTTFPFTLAVVLSIILLLTLSSCLFRFKRFKKGMPFVFAAKNLNLATTICLLIFALLMDRFFHNSNVLTRLITPILLIFALAFLIHWWQAQITKSYNHSVMLRNYESLTGELEEAYKKISTLEAQNEDQGRLIHHDNKRLAAMENAICEYLLSDFSDVESTKDRGRTLYLEIQSLSRNRSDTLKEIYEKKSRHYSTGIGSLDTLLNYMNKRATEDNIEFTVHNAVELETYIPKQISTEDLTHVLSDLLENAIIASKGTTNPVIQLQFYVSEKHFVIEVADSGIPFEAKSIVNFGLSRLTTHESTGGSGIGLMDIWSIKEKYGATLHIEEFETPHPFTKKISLVFNHKNLYSVKTYRADEITTLSKRHDLRIY